MITRGDKALQYYIQILWIAGIVALVLWGCACGVVTQHQVPWHYDLNCEAPTRKEWEQVQHATDLWLEWGIEMVQTDEQGMSLCLMTGEPEKGFVGWNSSGYIRIDRAADDMLGAVLAHEWGHTLLAGSATEDHLPQGQAGIMGSACDGTVWSDDDYLHIEEQLAW